MCQGILTRCMHEAHLTENCTLEGPCPFEMTEAEWKELEGEYYYDKADHRHENLEALKRMDRS